MKTNIAPIARRPSVLKKLAAEAEEKRRIKESMVGIVFLAIGAMIGLMLSTI